MLRYRKVFNSSTNKLILHQSFVDFLASFVFILRRLLVVSSAVPDNAIGLIYCKLWWSEWPQYGMFVTSTYNLAAISMERYFATCHSVRHRNMFSSYRLKFVMAAAWLCGWLTEAHLVPISHQINDACAVLWSTPTIQAVGGVFIFLWELVIPLSIMIFAYIRIILELHKRSKAREGDNNQVAQSMLSKANKNVTKTLLVVTIFFAVCWIPTDVNYILFNLGLNDNSFDSIWYQATGSIVLVNVCINPFIYCFTYDRFQKQARKMVCGRCRPRNNQVDTSLIYLVSLKLVDVEATSLSTMEASTVEYQSTDVSVDDSGRKTDFYVYMVLSVLGLIGNAFVCLVMLRYRKVFKSSTNKLILHQSFVDFLASFVFILRRLLLVSSAVPDNTIGLIYCKLWWSEWPQYGMFVTSTYNLAAISMERYFATCHSVSHRNMFSSYRLKFVMAAAWLCGWVPEAHMVPISHQINDACDVLWSTPTIQAVGGVFIFLWELVIPLSIMIFAYIRIILELHKRSKAREGDNNQVAQSMLSKANKNVTKTLLVVTIFFTVCWVPADVNYILFNLGLNDNSFDSIWYQAAGSIVVVNMCINPFIYCFTYDRFQRQARKMVCGRCRPRNNQVDTSYDATTRTATIQTIHVDE
ncbi:uncharacterized protein LOC119744980 [Patiria miniata]|uniref:G-protein coupled receptors family 1 profile domain-containing protein n=1 Tax=Patiria miniata TaxID=46514 RepID=A0A914BN20_PATMI|nr:uncharacterized protein LOC119744980 [Patiria miniata]